MIQPAFDLQVNGYVGVDFNDSNIDGEALIHACRALAYTGTGSILVAIITDHIDAMCAKISNIVRLRQQDAFLKKFIAGFHIEGPFINETPGYVGAHPVASVIRADIKNAGRLLDAADGLTKIVTLAPERDLNIATTRWLAEQNVVVSAGHCDPSLDQLDAAIDAGLSMFTHLGNGCPLHMHRHDNIIHRVLARSGALHIGLIADGVHLPFFVLKNLIAAAGWERCFIVTDTTAAGGMPPGCYQLGGQDVEIGEDLIAWSADHSHFVGSTTSMERSIANLRDHLALSDPQIDHLTGARFLRCPKN